MMSEIYGDDAISGLRQAFRLPRVMAITMQRGQRMHESARHDYYFMPPRWAQRARLYFAAPYDGAHISHDGRAKHGEAARSLFLAADELPHRYMLPPGRH